MIFGSKRKSTSKETALLQLDEREMNGHWFANFSLSKDGDSIKASEWESSQHEGAIWLISLLREEAEDAQIISESVVSVSFASLKEQMQDQESYLHKILELPVMFEGGIEIVGNGLLHQPEFKLDWYWNSSSGRRINAEQRESILIYGDRKYWLPNHAQELSLQLKSAKAAIETGLDLNGKLTELAEFKHMLNLLPAEEQQKVTQTSNIGGLKLYYANSFRIEAVPSNDSFSIKPVLLRRKTDPETEDPIFEAVLPPAEQERYSNFFANSTVLLGHYGLGVGKYIIISDRVNRALDYVHKVQHADSATKKAFLKNPKAAIQENLEGIFEEDELENVFSDRVIGIGEWHAKVIPWIKIPSQDWLPTGDLPDGIRGILVADEKIELSESQARELLSKVESAIKDDKPVVDFHNKQIPASNDTVKAIKQIFPEIPVKPTNYQSPTSSETPKETPLERAVMLVKENLECVQFAVNRKARSNVPANAGLPERLRTTPKSHQMNAYSWLCEHYRVGSRGVLLADDMGLGKTFQSLMFLSWLFEAMEAGEISRNPLLIIAPTGLLKNWEAEIELHLVSPLGHVVRAYGSGIQQLKKGNNLETSKLRHAGLVLTTYETVNRYQTAFSSVPFCAVVLDEAQKMKNPGTQNYTAVLSLNADFWVGMTGTPIENRLSDLWAIADLLQPGMLGSIKEFSNYFEKAMLVSNETAHVRLLELQNGMAKPTNNAPAFMLRRMKSDQLPDLPKKEIQIHSSTMPDEQSSAYSYIVENAKKGKATGGSFLETLHKIRACSLHPDYKRERFWKDDGFVDSSARLRACFEILDEVHRANEKALIFIEYNEWHRHDFLPAMIQRRYKMARAPMVINGQIDSASRQKRVDQFQSEKNIFDVMLLSPKAGGVGLTLTAANHVIHLTRWWNPAVEDQATDRIYRIGQKKTVHIHFPLALHPTFGEGSFDVILNRILEHKRSLREQTLISLPPNTDQVEDLLAKSMGLSDDSASILEDSYTFTGSSYQEYVMRKLQEVSKHFGFRVAPTPSSWDGGADMLVQTNDGVIIAVIQCKHVSAPDKTSLLSEDLERAIKSYGCAENVTKVGITNATKLLPSDVLWLGQSTSHLILKGEEGLNPEKLFQEL